LVKKKGEIKMVKLHLGCGDKYIPGFIHIDIAHFPHIDYRQSITLLPQFDDDSVDYIYCCHALEYLDRDEAVLALKEWHRVLKVDGILRIAVPDFDAIVKVYTRFANRDVEGRGILGPLYGKIDVGYRSIFHKTVYNYNSLKKMLKRVGFKDIQRYNWQETEHCNVDDFSQAYIPHMDKKAGLLISLNVEAKK
jgi:predicted SAM-dependent methyltransferase